MTSAKHTPLALPLNITNVSCIRDANNSMIADIRNFRGATFPDRSLRQIIDAAELFVHAVNNHDKLVEALEQILRYTDSSTDPAIAQVAHAALASVKEGACGRRCEMKCEASREGTGS